MKLINQYIFVAFISITLLGCNSSTQPSAEDVAVAFFDAIYNQKDINKAAALCSPTFAKKILKHRMAKQVARRLFNMSFDTVKIDAALGDIKIRQEFNTSGGLTILFTGYRNEKIYKDLKKIQLIKLGETWRVDRLLADPMPS
jgi:hypothetical protein